LSHKIQTSHFQVVNTLISYSKMISSSVSYNPELSDTQNVNSNMEYSKNNEETGNTEIPDQIKLSGTSALATVPGFISLFIAFGLGFIVGVKGPRLHSAFTSYDNTSYSVGTLTTSAIQQFPYASLLLAFVIAKEIWGTIPDWVKRNFPIFGRSAQSRISAADKSTSRAINKVNNNSDDLTSLAVIASKIQAMNKVINAKIAAATAEETDSQRTTEAAKDNKDDSECFHAAFLVLLKLTAQVKQQRADARDDRYTQDGDKIAPEMVPKVLEGLDETFELADWAYDDWEGVKGGGEEVTNLQEALATKGYDLVRHDKIALPGHVSYYVAISKERKTILIGVKGTSTFEDVLTDCCGSSIKHELRGPFIRAAPQDREHVDNTFNPINMQCHEGIMLAALNLADDLEPSMEQLFLPTGYQLLVTGHSLGAGVAALFSVIMRSRFPDQLIYADETRLKVIAFAPPPVLDHDSALACKSFITSVVNNSDMIPRASLANLLVLVEFLEFINAKLEEKGISPKGIISTALLIKRLMEGNKGKMLLTAEEFKEGLDQATEKVALRDPDHLYVPGTVYHMYDLWGTPEYKEHIKAEADAVKKGLTEVQARTAECLQIDDGTYKPLRNIELDPRMLTDHLSLGYRTSIKSLLNPPIDPPKVAPKETKVESETTKEANSSLKK